MIFDLCPNTMTDPKDSERSVNCVIMNLYCLDAGQQIAMLSQYGSHCTIIKYDDVALSRCRSQIEEI